VAESRAIVDVPGSSANLGPGYDCLAIALPFRLRVEAERRPGPLSVRVSGEGANVLPADASNLVVSTLLTELDERGDDLAIEIRNDIPLGAPSGMSLRISIARSSPRSSSSVSRVETTRLEASAGNTFAPSPDTRTLSGPGRRSASTRSRNGNAMARQS